MAESKVSNWVFESLTRGDNFSAKLARISNLMEKYKDDGSSSIAGMPAVGFDLDRTMVYTTNSMSLVDMDDTTFLRVAEVFEGKPFAYITSAAYSMLEIINENAFLVPVTTRTVSQYRRIRIPGMTEANFLPHTATQYAVTSNGGRILVNGEEDKDWTKHVEDNIVDTAAPLKQVNELLKTAEKHSWLIKRRSAEDLFAYLVLDRAETPVSFLDDVEAQLDEWGWAVSMQGRKFYCVPKLLTKGTAFSEVVKRSGADYAMAAGDSLLDIPLLETADFAFRPRHGELQTTNYTAENLTVTDNQGIIGGEEIVARVLAKIHANQ
jgi:hydroxymethylpyrimidine pyrophosphatase-like HAD family hydrolase